MKMMEFSLKFKYNRTNKNMFDPFRSKDIQAIYMEIIRKVINVDELTRKKILIKIFSVHDMGAHSDIEDKHAQTSWWSIIKQNFLDHKYQEYNAATSIKNYLGERWGFIYAFKYFYTSWLLIPAVMGIFCSFSMAN